MFFGILYYGLVLRAQPTDADIRLARQLDSLSKSNSLSRHFATLYLETTLIAIRFFNKAPAREKQFIERLEHNFSGFFLKAASAKQEERSAIWQNYFRDSSLSPLQYQLLGINAHINGDIWQSLVSEFSLEELSANKKSYSRFQRGLKLQFRRFYRESRETNFVTRLLDRGTAGFAAEYGIVMLARWRKRQYQLAILHYTNPEKCKKRLEVITRKKERLDQLILRHL